MLGIFLLVGPKPVTNLRQTFFREQTTASDHEKCDIIADSALYDLEGVDFIWGVAIDVFHICFEGISKLMLIRLFLVRNTKESREVLGEVNFLYVNMKVFSETASTARPINQVLSLKGNELKVLTMSLFPVLGTSVIRHELPMWYGFPRLIAACHKLFPNISGKQCAAP